MGVIDKMLFAEELLNLFDRHGIEGVAGVFITDENMSLVMQVHQPGASPLPYTVVCRVITKIMESQPDIYQVESGEGSIKRPPHNNNEMPH